MVLVAHDLVADSVGAGIRRFGQSCAVFAVIQLVLDRAGGAGACRNERLRFAVVDQIRLCCGSGHAAIRFRDRGCAKVIRRIFCQSVVCAVLSLKAERKCNVLVLSNFFICIYTGDRLDRNIICIDLTTKSDCTG